MCHTHFSFLSLFISSLKLIIYLWRGKKKKVKGPLQTSGPDLPVLRVLVSVESETPLEKDILAMVVHFLIYLFLI